MKKTKRGVERFLVTMLAAILVMESVSMPVNGEVKSGASAQTGTIGEQISDNSVAENSEDTVSANFVYEEETDVFANTTVRDEEISAERETVEYSGVDGDLEWSIDSDGELVIMGTGDYKDTPDWISYKNYIESASVSVQGVTSLKGFLKNCNQLKSVQFADLDTTEVTDMSEMFYGCYNLNSVDLRGFDTENVTTMKNMFWGCQKIDSLHTDVLTTGNVTDMSYMFYGCEELQCIDISGFDMKNVTTVAGMFKGCSAVEEITIGKLNTANVTCMDNMFCECKKLETIDMSKVDTSGVNSMENMFARCENATEININTFDTSDVVNMKAMFLDCAELEILDVSNMDTSKVRNMESMFDGCRKLKVIDVSGFNTEKVMTMKHMFANCNAVKELDVSNFNTHIVNNMTAMFMGCNLVKKLEVSGFKTEAVTAMDCMFSGCMLLKKLDVSGFDTSNVTNMVSMFASCSSLKELDIENFDTTKTENMAGMFRGCTNLADLEFGEKDVSKVKSMESMFEGCRAMKKIDIPKLNCVNTKNMNRMFKDCSGLVDTEDFSFNAYSLESVIGMFQGCSSLEKLTFMEGADAITDMGYMFQGCTSLQTIDLTKISAYKVTNMSYLFADCSSLTNITFPDEIAPELEYMSGMFKNCSSLRSMDLDDFDAPNVKNISALFLGCTNLKTVDMGEYDIANSEMLTYLFSECDSLEEVDLTGFDAENITFIRGNFDGCDRLHSIYVSPSFMEKLVTSDLNNFVDCKLFSDIYYSGTMAEWENIKTAWQSCAEKKLRDSAVHLSNGTVEQQLLYQGDFRYYENGGGVGKRIYQYSCDFSNLFSNSYVYQHDLAKMSIRVAMSSMSTPSNTNSYNIETLMDDLNVTHRKVHYPKPEYDSIGYAMGARRIYHNNQKKTLIMIAIRSGGYGAEWGGNANVGAGVNHAGFDIAANQVYVALNQYLGELKESGFIEEGDKDITVWISGFSRGAATTNLLAAKLSSAYLEEGILEEYDETEDHVKDIVSTNVFAFCFECPQNTTDKGSHSGRYNNIFNIINLKDIVTKVAMNNGIDWKYQRYGRDLVLPDEANTNSKDYIVYNQNMELKYQGDNVPKFDLGHSEKVSHVAKKMSIIIPRIYYPIAYQTIIQDMVVNLMVYETGMGEAICRAVSVIGVVGADNALFSPAIITSLGTEALKIKDKISVAHYPELCMAWMDSISEDVLTKQKSFWNVFVNCPVDIYVYEGEKLVGCIKNDVPQQIENGVITMLDSNGQKKIVLPGDSEYKLVYKATGDGTMTISTSKYVQAESLPETVAGYYELPLKTGTTYEAETTMSGFELMSATGETIEASVKQSGDEVRFYKVDLSVEGNGEAEGIGTYSIGEYAKVTASPAEGEEFLGWYESGTLVSSQTDYRFCVKKDAVLKAKFTNHINESEKEQQKADEPSEDQGEKSDETQSAVKVGKSYTIKKHTYKITNVKKKTVAFVKTKSKSKTITIPSTVKIKGKKYKVTSVAANALRGNKKVTKVTIGSNVTSIGKNAFYKCTSLKKITIPSKVKTIGENAFSECKKIQKVTIGKNVTKIGKKAFYKCTSLKAIKIPSKVNTIGEGAFSGCVKLTKVTIGSNVTSIGKNAFYKCTSLKTITLPSKIKTIGESAFSGCKKLQKVIIGKSVTKIGKKAFYNCKKLKTITIKSKKLKSIGKYAFKGIATQAKIKCPEKQYKKYKKMIVKSKVGKKVKIKK